MAYPHHLLNPRRPLPDSATVPSHVDVARFRWAYSIEIEPGKTWRSRSGHHKRETVAWRHPNRIFRQHCCACVPPMSFASADYTPLPPDWIWRITTESLPVNAMATSFSPPSQATHPTQYGWKSPLKWMRLAGRAIARTLAHSPVSTSPRHSAPGLPIHPTSSPMMSIYRQTPQERARINHPMGRVAHRQRKMFTTSGQPIPLMD